MRSPIVYFGGKGLFVKKILPFIPQHKIYVEVFGGGASLLFAKTPSEVEIYNDAWEEVVNFFRVLKDENLFKQFYRQIIFVPYSRTERKETKNLFDLNTRKNIDCIKRAVLFHTLSRQSFGGNIKTLTNWGFSIKGSSRDISSQNSRYIWSIDLLPEHNKRLQNVIIENDGFEKIIKKYDTKDTFFYLDPPYIRSTRKGGGYKHEMTDEQHKQLVDMLLNIKGQFILSGYKHEIYKPLEKICEVKEFETSCHAAGRTRYTKIQGKGSASKKQPRTEVLWIKV